MTDRRTLDLNDMLSVEMLSPNVRLVSIVDGVAQTSNGSTIKQEHMMYQTVPSDGTYSLGEATCGGSCSIGKPSEKCIKSGAYSIKKCSVYSFDNIKHVRVSIEDLLKTMSEKRS